MAGMGSGELNIFQCQVQWKNYIWFKLFFLKFDQILFSNTKCQIPRNKFYFFGLKFEYINSFHLQFESNWQNIHRIILKRILNIPNSFQIPERTNAKLYWISGPTAKLCETAKIVAESLVIRNSWTTWCNASWLQCYEWLGCDSKRTRARKIYQKMFSNWKWAGKWRCFWIWWTSQQQTVSKKNYTASVWYNTITKIHYRCVIFPI